MGGIERVISLLSKGFSVEQDIQLTLLSMYSKPGDCGIFSLSEKTELVHLGCPVNEKPDKRLLNFFATNRFDDLVTFHPGIAMIISRIINRIRPVRWIATEHNDPFNYTWKRRLLNLYVYRTADVFVLLTERNAEYYRRRMLRNTAVIPNPVSFVCNDQSDYPKNIIAVGRIEEIKRFDLIIKAFGSIENTYPDWKLRIVGIGTCFDRLVNESKEYKNIVFLGQRVDIKELMLDSSFLVISSQYEGFPLVALEALECGLPIVSTDLPAIKHITKGYNAATFAPHNDWKSLAGKMEELICSPSLIRRMGKEAKACAKQYSLENVVMHWKNIL